jgi:two-component system, OmpR family, response regulator ResD
MQRILVCDDEVNIVKLICKYLEHAGFQTAGCYNGLEVLDLLKFESFDLLILDIMMPEMDGYTTVKELRKKYSLPVLMLSAMSEEQDKILGFELGIDDYQTKPFSPLELVMRVKAILARYLHVVPQSEVLVDGELVVNLNQRQVRIDNQLIDLSFKEYELLVYLLTNRHNVLTREQLLNHVWGYDYYGDERTLDTHIKLLRKCLGTFGARIVTVRGVGYRYEQEN